MPDCDSDEDEDFKQQDKELKACLPFAVVGSNTILEVNGKKMRGRQYDWGLVEGVCDLTCSPFISKIGVGYDGSRFIEQNATAKFELRFDLISVFIF